MNDIDFQQQAHANPWDNSPEFVAAINQKPERATLIATLQAQDQQLTEALSAPVPESLKAKLLSIPDTDHAAASASNTSTVVIQAAWRWQKMLPLAASMVLAIAVVLNFLPATTNEALANDVMEHLYAELAFLDSHGNVSRTELNDHLAKYGGTFADNSDMNAVEASVVADCWIEKEQQSHFHMVMKGQYGPVTLVIMSGDPVSSPLTVSDDRFDGILIPTPKGNLVVAGEKGESVEAIANMFAASITW